MDRGYLMDAFFFGLGYSSTQASIAMRMPGQMADIRGTVTTAQKAQLLAAQGIAAHVFDGTSPGATLRADLRKSSHVILSIAPGAEGDPALLHHRADLDAAEGLQWLCYYSTVGVYGDFGGDWIDELAPLVPRNDRSDRRVLAEQAWRDYARARGVPLAILRLAEKSTGRAARPSTSCATARRGG